MAATANFTWGNKWSSQAFDEDSTETQAQTKWEDTKKVSIWWKE